MSKEIIKDSTKPKKALPLHTRQEPSLGNPPPPAAIKGPLQIEGPFGVKILGKRPKG